MKHGFIGPAGTSAAQHTGALSERTISGMSGLVSSRAPASVLIFLAPALRCCARRTI